MDKGEIEWIKNPERKHEELYNAWNGKRRDFIQNKDKASKTIKELIENVIDKKDLDKETKEKIKKDYHSYPDYRDPDFNTEISKKAEFHYSKGLLDLIALENRCFSTNFELGNHQYFLKSFMNRNTPYQGILIFHGVGVGKTCTAVTISNSFIDRYKKEDKKIICLVSKNIQPNWMNTIYNPEKGDNQCNGDQFQNIIGNLDKKPNTSGRVKKLIREYYEFYGYQQFSNKVKKLISIKKTTAKNRSHEEIEKKIIKDYFSDRLLIIDEVHNLRDDNLDNYSKDTIKFLDKVIRYSNNLRLIIMSATPMFNKATEIQWILNLLLKNDKRPTVSNKELFNTNGSLKKSGIELLKKKSRGYVSYVRGENPITFPIRIYPDNNSINDPRCHMNYPINDLYGVPYSEDSYKFKFLKLYYSDMTDYQSQIYQKFIQSLNQTENLQISEQRAGIQISNIVFPSVDVLLNKEKITEKNFKKFYGGSGMFKVVEGNRNGYTYNREWKKSPEFFPIFDLNHIQKFSTKIHTLLTGLRDNKAKGIIFIYSEFIPSGIFPLAFALEHMGFEKYSGNLFEYPEWKKGSTNTKNKPIDFNWNPMSEKKGKRAKYIILSGNKDLSPNNAEEVKELVSDNNSEGQIIKVVIGNIVAAEGLDLKNIREIHVLDPWYHLSRIEQIIGRGIRYCSHSKLDDETERNVTVYLHAATNIEPEDKDTEKKEEILENLETETVDTYIYRKAEEKAIEIGRVETILKENAIDCYLNKQINQIKKGSMLPVQLTTSRGVKIENFDVHDKEYSKICSFRGCDYECECDEDIKEEDINYDTFDISKNTNDLFQSIKNIILELYEINNYYSLEELIIRITETVDTNKNIIYHTLYNMIDQKTAIWNKEGMSGFLISQNNYYLFQPDNNTDKTTPLYYRNIDTIDVPRTIPLGEIDFDGIVKEDVESEGVLRSNEEIYKMIEEKEEENEYKEYIPNFRFENLIHFEIEKLKYGEKVNILKELLEDESNDKIKNDIYKYFENNIIYEKDEKYYLFKKKYNVIGFFLMNPIKLIEKKKRKIKELDEVENDYSYFIYHEESQEYKDIDELEDGQMIKNDIKTNFLKIKGSVPYLRTEKIWGYPFKMKKWKANELVWETFFKLVDEKKQDQGEKQFPGRVLNQIANKGLIIDDFLKKHFKGNYDDSIKDKPKQFICELIEMIVRNKKVTNAKVSFIPYDLVFLKFIN